MSRSDGRTAVLNLFGAKCMADPFPTYAWYREHAPVRRLTQPDGLQLWLVTGYHDSRAALADPRLAHHLRHARPAMARAGIELTDERIRFGAAHLLHSEPSDHARLRRLVARAFSPARVQRLRPRVREIAGELLTAIDPSAEVDLVRALNNPLPVMVICELLGIPAEDRTLFRQWTEAAVTPEYQADPPMSRDEGKAHLRSYLADLVSSRRAERLRYLEAEQQPDLLRALIVACDDESRLTETEVVAMSFIMLIAGHESTSNFLGNAFLTMLRAPALQHALEHSSGTTLAHAVDELLRFDGPVQRGTLRTAVEDVEISGVTVPAGEIVSVCVAAANRDPRRFPDADDVRLDRNDNPHLAFGHGPHFCVGASLARMEAEVAIGAVLHRFDEITLAVQPSELRWRPAFQRGLVGLPVRVR